jgi:hypothetical protein
MTDPAMSQSNVPNFVELGEAGIGQGYHGIGVRVNLPEMMLSSVGWSNPRRI